MMLMFRNTQTKIATALTTAYATVVGTATGALKIFKLALVATGIGAIIVGLGLLIANFDLVSEAVIKGAKRVQNMAKEFREMGTGMQILIGYLTFGLVPAISYAIKLFEDMGVVDDEETKKMKSNAQAKRDAIKKQTDAIISDLNRQSDANKKATDDAVNNLDYEIRKRQAAGKETKDLEREKIMLLINSTKTELALIQQRIDAKQKEIENSGEVNKVLAGINKIKEEERLKIQKATLDKLVQDLEIFDIGERKRAMDEIARKKETSKKKTDIVKKEISEEDKLRKAQQDADKKAFDLKQKAIADEEAVAEAYRQRQLSAQQKELDDLNEKLNNELLAVGNNEELKLLLEEEYLAKKNAIVNKYIDLEDEAKKKANEEELDRRLALADKINEKAQQGLDFADNLNAIFGKNSEKAAKREFQINKTKNVADATVDGYKAVLSTFANTPTGIVGKSIAATAAGVFAASNIARIVSSRYEGGGGGGSASVSIPRVSSGGANGGATGQAQQNDNLTNIASLLNNQPSPVLVVDKFQQGK